MTAGVTYTPIATTTLGSDQTTVTFSSISASYTDLVVIVNCGIDNALGAGVTMRLNNDSGNNYSTTRITGNGSSAASYREANNSYIFNYNTFVPITTNVIFNLQNYSNTTTNKTILQRFNEPSLGTAACVSLWRSTAAINRIDISPEFTTIKFKAGSTFTIYGLVAA